MNDTEAKLFSFTTNKMQGDFNLLRPHKHVSNKSFSFEEEHLYLSDAHHIT